MRAYPTGEAAGDSGYLISGELRYIIPDFKLLGGDVTPSIFYDQGEVKLAQTPLVTTVANRRALAGYGFGVSMGKDGGFLVKASIALQAENERPISDNARRVPRAWVQAIKWF